MAAFGYFGHMWELYTFWAFIPVMVGFYQLNNPADISISFWSFVVIAIGGIGCILGGYISQSKGSKRVAQFSLWVSGFCCLLTPFLFHVPLWLFLGIMMVWGLTVVSDSPQFSTLVADSANRSYVATGLTIVNSLGFAITIVSIQLVTLLWVTIESPFVFWVMLAGPIFGLWAINKFQSKAYA